MCDNGIRLVGFDPYKARFLKIIRTDCESWSCDYCANILRLRWRLRIKMHLSIAAQRGDQYAMITLTRPPHEHADTNRFKSACAIAATWNAFMQAIRRRCRNLQYIAVLEHHRSGSWHRHLVTNYIPGDVYIYIDKNGKEMRKSRELQRLLERFGWGWVHDVREIEDVEAGAAYISKYLTKQTHENLPRRQRLITCSRGWWKIPQPASSNSDLVWLKVPKSLEHQDDIFILEYLNQHAITEHPHGRGENT